MSFLNYLLEFSHCVWPHPRGREVHSGLSVVGHLAGCPPLSELHWVCFWLSLVLCAERGRTFTFLAWQCLFVWSHGSCRLWLSHLPLLLSASCRPLTVPLPGWQWCPVRPVPFLYMFMHFCFVMGDKTESFNKTPYEETKETCALCVPKSNSNIDLVKWSVFIVGLDFLSKETCVFDLDNWIRFFFLIGKKLNFF